MDESAGADWERLAPPAPGGAVVNHASIASDGRSALLTIASGEHGEVLETWHTIDGETWRVANGGASERNGLVGTIHPTDFGWAAYDAFEESTRMTVSPDGIVWQEISADVPDGHEFSDQHVAALGHVVVFGWFEDFGDRTTWVGRVDAG